ncbi:MAG TPA: MFS transporter [Blastocatellia bacterium]|nr:MFS transporter [Blastocatellia bacterium]
MSTETTVISAAVETPTPGPRAARETGEPWPSPGRAWYAVFIFALSLMINFLDRGIVSLLVTPIKRDLNLTDVQVSLVMGFAFICCYVILGLPIARWADFRNRRTILGIGVMIWSLMTAACGLAQSFWQLFVCRVGVGAGEACSGPATYSMLADLFPPQRLPRAIAVLNFGFYAGMGLALIVGGTVTQLLVELPPVTLPLIGPLRHWQSIFLVVGIPGLLVAALITTVREPRRRGTAFTAAGRPQPLPVREVLTFIREQAPLFAPLFLGVGIETALAFGTGSWAPTFYLRTFGWTPARYGLVQGLIMISVLPVGAFIGSLLAERFARQGRPDANLRVVLIAQSLALPASVLFPLMPTPGLALLVSTWSLFCQSWVAGPINAAIQITTPNQMRGQITALLLFIFNVIGFGLGPTAVAIFTDYVFHAEGQLGYSLSAAALVLGPLGLFAIRLSLKPYGRRVAALTIH